LKETGLNLPDEVARRVCEERLVRIFSDKAPSNAVYRKIWERRAGCIEDYIAAMEYIWRGKLFSRPGTIKELGQSLTQKANELWEQRQATLSDEDRDGKAKPSKTKQT
jgi:hypothetical protein